LVVFSNKYQYNSLNELVIMIINGFILAVITILTINMVTSGMPIFQNDATKAFAKQNKINDIKRGEYFGRLGMENSEKSLLALLIIYNVAVY
jgi:flagellar biosynthesis protein FlhB